MVYSARGHIESVMYSARGRIESVMYSARGCIEYRVSGVLCQGPY